MLCVDTNVEDDDDAEGGGGGGQGRGWEGKGTEGTAAFVRKIRGDHPRRSHSQSRCDYSDMHEILPLSFPPPPPSVETTADLENLDSGSGYECWSPLSAKRLGGQFTYEFAVAAVETGRAA